MITISPPHEILDILVPSSRNPESPEPHTMKVPETMSDADLQVVKP